MTTTDDEVGLWPGPATAPTDGPLTFEELQLAGRNRGMPLEALRYDITPTGLHYLLVHFDIPAVDPATWRLRLDGLVDRPLELSLDDLRARPRVTVPVTLECAGNGRTLYERRPESQPWIREAVGTAEAVKKLSGLYRQEWDAKANLGSRVHTLAEAVLRGQRVGPSKDEAPYLEGLANFIADAHPIPIALEEMVAFEDELGVVYAGTFDAVLQLASGRWLVDFKTGKEIYAETALQLAGYAYASFVGRPGTVQRYVMPEIDLYAVCHLHPSHPRGYAFVPYDVGRREWDAFMSLLDVWEWTHTKGRAKRERMIL
jgi:hypothetical protein